MMVNDNQGMYQGIHAMYTVTCKNKINCEAQGGTCYEDMWGVFEDTSSSEDEDSIANYSN